MSSGKSQQVSTTELPGWMQPYGQDLLSRASAISQRPYQAYTGQTVASMDPLTQQGINAQAQLGRQGTQAGNAGTQLLTDTLGGNFLKADSNPYLSGQIDMAQQDVARNYNLITKPQTESAMVNSGSFGNSGLMEMQRQQQSDVMRNMGNISTQMRGNAYNTERGNMMSALGMAPQYSSMAFGNAQALQDAGRMQQSHQQMELSDAYRRWQEAQGYDANQLGVLGNALGTLRGSQTTTSGNNPNSGAQNAQLLGSLAMLGYSIFSDRRLKTDIKKVGKTDDGLGVYTYKYKWGGPTQMGVMAQEVEKKNPEAITKVNGYRAVNYGLLGG